MSKKSIEKEFKICKKSLIHNRLVIAVKNTDETLIAFLKPICFTFREDMPEIPILMSKWRVENPTISAGMFKVTEERTISWLDSLVLQVDDRIIFMIESYDGVYLGHLGFTNYDESRNTIDLDSVLRGVKGMYPGLMSLSVLALMAWGFEKLNIDNIELEVLSDNITAIKFYENIGFETSKTTRLIKVIKEDEEKYEVAKNQLASSNDKYYLRMVYTNKGII